MDSKFQGDWHRCHGERAVALGVPPIMDPPVDIWYNVVKTLPRVSVPGLGPVKISTEYLAQIETAISIIYGKYVYTYG